MEKCFIATKESQYFKNVVKYQEMFEKRREQIFEFLALKNIETRSCYVRGSGGVNSPFSDYEQSSISLYITPTDNDEKLLGKSLKKPIQYGLRDFRKGNKILKEFQQYCVDNRIVVNINAPEMRDYFKTIGWYKYESTQFPCEEGYCIEIDSEFLKEDDIPQGFEVIKRSEFYSRLEKFEEENKEDK